MPSATSASSEGDFAPGALDNIAGNHDRAFGNQRIERGAEKLRPGVSRARSQVFFGNALDQGIRSVECFHLVAYPAYAFRHSRSGCNDERLLANHEQRSRLGKSGGSFADLRFEPARAGHNLTQLESLERKRCHGRKDLFAIIALDGREVGRDVLIALAVARRQSVQHHAAADRHHRRKLAQNEAVAGQHEHRFVEAKLRKGRIARG